MKMRHRYVEEPFQTAQRGLDLIYDQIARMAYICPVKRTGQALALYVTNSFGRSGQEDWICRLLKGSKNRIDYLLIPQWMKSKIIEGGWTELFGSQV